MDENQEQSESLFVFTKEDLQKEAIEYLGREMNEEEYAKAKKLLDFGIGENMKFILLGVFSNIGKDTQE